MLSTLLITLNIALAISMLIFYGINIVIVVRRENVSDKVLRYALKYVLLDGQLKYRKAWEWVDILTCRDYTLVEVPKDDVPDSDLLIIEPNQNLDDNVFTW